MTSPAQTAAQTATRPAPASSSLPGAGRKRPAFYAEYRNTYGAWVPCLFVDPPRVDERDRQLRTSSVGPVMRQMGTDERGKVFCKAIPPYLAHLTLDQLHAVLSPDGRLAATAKGGA